MLEAQPNHKVWLLFLVDSRALNRSESSLAFARAAGTLLTGRYFAARPSEMLITSVGDVGDVGDSVGDIVQQSSCHSGTRTD